MSAPGGRAAEKAALRAHHRRLRRQHDPADLRRRSAALCAALQRSPAWANAHTVLLYHAMPGEVDPSSLELGGRAAAWPVVQGAGEALRLRGPGPLEARPMGRALLWQPGPACPDVDPAAIDLVVVPGLAFDPAGGRLGMGGGFYDRTLARIPGRRVGLCLREHLVDAVPMEPWDLPVHEVFVG